MSQVKAILIDIGGDEKRLTIAEAKKLHAALDELLGTKPATVLPAQPYRPFNPLDPYVTMNATAAGNFSTQIGERMSLSAITD